MNQPTTASPTPHRSWQDVRYRWATIPGWGLSLVVHALFLLLLSTSLKSCGGTMTGEVEGEYRQVGLVMKDSVATDSPEASDSRQTPTEQSTQVTEELPEVPDKPPVEMALPEIGADILGPGAIAPPAGLPAAPTTAAPSLPNSIPLPSALGRGDGPIKFIGAEDTGTTFVYVIDCSSSMAQQYDALSFAKAELLASLESLGISQKFQIFFYNESVEEMRLKGQSPDDRMYVANDFNRNRAKSFTNTIYAQLGTKHMPALERAIDLRPDVIFFLTDAQEPQLTAGELSTLKKRNAGRSRIHCIEFGRHSPLAADNFLKRLARQNGGTYSYRDVTKISKGR